MQNKNLDLNNLIMQEGQPFDETKQKLVTGMIAERLINDAPLPGQSVNMPLSNDVAMTKEEATDNLLMHAAINKLKKENEEYKKLSDDEKVKDYVCQSQFYYETNEFFKKNGYEMSGKQKRMTKRAIENAWKKGKLKVTPEKREDILYELSKASNQNLDLHTENTTEKSATSNISENIKDLNSLIFRQ